MRRSPTAIALTIGGTSLSYADLWQRACHLAVELRNRGAGPETFVGIPADRSADTLVAILGVLISGAAYVPFSADLPHSRIRLIMNDAGLELFVGSVDAVRRLPADVSAVVSDGQTNTKPPNSGVRPSHPAYVIFTSGSTGAPKGVVTEHRQIVNSTLARFPVFPMPCSAYVMLAPFTFDAAAAGTYFTLVSGGRLVIPTDEEVHDPALLARLITDQRASHVDGVPSQYAALLAFHPEAMRDVRCTVLAGEALPMETCRMHYRAAANSELFNEYGPSEGTVWSTVHRVRGDEPGPLAPIGRPINNVQVRVVDESLVELASGRIGEIVIAGAGLSRGYLNRPDLTAARFVPDPWTVSGGRLYRTGDLGLINEEGELVFCGRADDQIKVRGFRVEPSEIESRLLAYPNVTGAVIVGYRTQTGTRLMAFVATSGSPPSGRELAGFLADYLPDYMIPGRWQFVDRLPSTAHGKVDRRSLVEAAQETGGCIPFGER